MAFTRKTWTGAPDERFTYEDWNRYMSVIKRRYPKWDMDRTQADMLTIEDLNEFENKIADIWYSGMGESIDDTYFEYSFGTWRPGKVIGYKTVNMWEEILWRLS